jgi:phosphohistidine phosphatase SixA
MRTLDELTPGSKRKRLARALLSLEEESVGLVGHQPDLGEFTAWLIGDSDVHIELAKAGIAYVRCEGAPTKGGGELVWLVTPEWLT